MVEATVDSVSRPASRWILTGGIGSGKSTVSRMLEVRGATVVDADRIGHEVLEPGGPAFARVASRWPGCVVDGRIDRRRLGAIVFDDQRELEVLEAITHPEIRRVLDERLADLDDHVIVVEVSVPNVRPAGEWGWIVVDAPDEVRRARAVARGLSDEQVRARMAAQPNREEWLALADLVIDNGGSLVDLAEAVERAWYQMRSSE